MAIAAKRRQPGVRVHVILGDGELDEGQVWEAAMAAPRFALDNLVAIIDRNRYQNDGATEEILPLEPLADKWRAFRWNVIEIDGHNFDEIDEAFCRADRTKARPPLSSRTRSRGRAPPTCSTSPSCTTRLPRRSSSPAR